jgi:hypothetical protein
MACRGTLVVFFHVASTDAAAPQNVGMVRMLPMMDIADFLRLTHLAGYRWFPGVFDINEGPAFIRHSRL